MRRYVICLYDLHHPSNFFLPISQPSAGKPDTQPPIRRLALPLIRSITQPNARASSYRPTTQYPSFHQPRHTIQTHSFPSPAGNSIHSHRPTSHPANTALSSKWCWCESYHLTMLQFTTACPKWFSIILITLVFLENVSINA